MRVLVVSSCTGEKLHRNPRALTLEDFRQGSEHVACREEELAHLLTPAEALYTGQQHVRLMRGIRATRTADSPLLVSTDLWILSAGYGLVPGERKLAPYEATFKGMGKPAQRAWARQLGVPEAFRRLLAQPYDLGLILLGDEYLEACALDGSLVLGGSTLLFCGRGATAKLPRAPQLRLVTVSNSEAKRFACPLISLKGELAARLLAALPEDPRLLGRVLSGAKDLLALLEQLPSPQSPAVQPSERKTSLFEDGLAEPGGAVTPWVGEFADRAVADTGGPVESGEAPSGELPQRVPRIARPNPAVDRVIVIPSSWWEKPHRQKLRYFIPEWDDLVDPDYDFATDTHSGGQGDWSNEVYAHQLYPQPNYDGILVSKVVAEKSRKKRERINALGVHRYLRVPREFPIMGDCGAFGYIQQEVPPYSTQEILDYYTRLGFDYGVSVDHLIVTATEPQKQFRYELTIHNAEEFLREHRKAGLPWEPIGAVQGWDPKSYAEAARRYVAMGYRYIGLGGLVRTSTPEVVRILEAVHRVVPSSVHVHLFGLARLEQLAAFSDLGVRSVDSASFIRRAWMGTVRNYLAEDGTWFGAVRIPEGEKSFRAKRIVDEGRASLGQARRLEANCLRALRDLDRGLLGVERAVEIIHEYDQLITPDRLDNRKQLLMTLSAAPWKRCACSICREHGVEVVLFRGNNRNRRRGFHNTYVFYRLVQRVLAGERVSLRVDMEEDQALQLSFPLAV